MRYVVLRGVVVGLLISFAVLSPLGAWKFGCWLGSVLHGPPELYLDMQ